MTKSTKGVHGKRKKQFDKLNARRDAHSAQILSRHGKTQPEGSRRRPGSMNPRKQ